ncbi:hypothetical protein ABZ784_29095 [Streptomyces tendae]|uniref:hypothetical protein n=1 Tax=Streptomyces tendae TaxID=1932 RepID=UPI0033D0ACFA
MPATATVTVDSLIRRHAADLAYVAEATAPATDLDTFLHHLDYAADNFDQARINGHDDLNTAGTLLAETLEADGDVQERLTLRAAALLKVVPEMTGEYRDMVGD